MDVREFEGEHVDHRRDDPDYPDTGEQDDEQPGRGRAGDQDAEEGITERGDLQEELALLHPFCQHTAEHRGGVLLYDTVGRLHAQDERRLVTPVGFNFVEANTAHLQHTAIEV